jgi:hypothetical protein
MGCVLPPGFSVHLFCESKGELDLPSYVWHVGPAMVRHLCQYRFGHEQHIRITRY